MFKVLSKEEYEALDTRSQVKYEIELEAYKKAEQDKAIKEAVDAQLESVKAESAKSVEDMKAEFEAKLKEAQDKLQDEADRLYAKMKEQNAFNTSRSERQKTMSDYIEAQLSTEKGEDMLKAFLAGNRKDLNIEVEGVEKAVFMTPTGGVPVDYLGIANNSYGRVHGRNLMPVYPTLSNMISFLRLVQDPDSDGIQITAEGDLKGEIEYLPTEVQVPVVKIAGYVNLTEEAWDDTVGLRAWLANELPKAYLKAEDEYIFMDPTHGVYTLASNWIPDGAINAWDTLISALAQLEKADQYGTAILVSPDGRKELRRNKDLINGLYTYPIVSFDNGVLRFDGIPVYSTNILTGYQFLVGDFAEGVELRQRKGMQVRYSTENEDNFVKNLITVLIEGRVAVCVKKPTAFVKGNLVVTPITT